MSKTARFITVEGGEGAGKSTLVRALADQIETRFGVSVMTTREPGGSPGAEAIRGLLLFPPQDVHWAGPAEALLFNAARRDHLQHAILPALAAGRWVLCDRFLDSTRAYQIARGDISAEAINALERISVGENRPDLTLILDVPPEFARARLLKRGGDTDAIEARGEAYHARVRAEFLAIAAREPDRCAVLDAAIGAEELLDAAIAEVVARLGPSE